MAPLIMVMLPTMSSFFSTYERLGPACLEGEVVGGETKMILSWV
jgi:hypothetical protein